MSYGMVGSGRYSSRLNKMNKLRMKALDLLQRTSRNDSKYARRLNMKHRLDDLYSKVYNGINRGLLSPDYEAK